MRWFFGLWAASLCHAAALRHGQRHWVQQCTALCAIALAAVLANWAGSGGGPWAMLNNGRWAPLGVDLALLSVSAAAGYATWRLRLQTQVGIAPRPRLVAWRPPHWRTQR